MVGMPLATPVTTPPAVIVASEVLLELQVPLAVPSLKVVVDPSHTEAVPVIAAGLGFTVISNVTKQLVAIVYVIVTVPAFTPVTTPVPAPIVAVVISLLLQLPPTVASVKVVFAPVQTVVEPDIAKGVGLTVISYVATQPLGSVYVIVGVPAATPVTVPVVEPTVARPVLLLVHSPPPVASVNVILLPMQTLVGPPIPAGVELNVTTCVAEQPETV